MAVRCPETRQIVRRNRDIETPYNADEINRLATDSANLAKQVCEESFAVVAKVMRLRHAAQQNFPEWARRP